MGQRKKIGIIGDGQLALMLAEALEKREVPFLALSTSHESPMHTFFPQAVTSDQKKFREECTIFTLENEFHTIPELRLLLGNKIDLLFPEAESYAFFADKISQRMFFEKCGISSPRWLALRSLDQLPELSRFTFPFVLKASKGGYDGKGVRVIENQKNLEEALIDFRFREGNELLVEEKVDIFKELAQGFLRHRNGNYTFLPLVDTVQEKGVCNLVKYPASVNDAISEKIELFLKKMMDHGLVGIFNFEFFLDKTGNVLINEGAPRTHNSQHLTIDASTHSQFDLLALYLADPLLAPETISTRSSLMVNILGKRSGPPGELRLPEFTSLEIHPKLYGKNKSSPGRKLGHVNVVDDSGSQDLLSIGRQILQEYDI